MTRFATHGENCAERESPVVILAAATVFRIMTRHISPRYSYSCVRWRLAYVLGRGNREITFTVRPILGCREKRTELPIRLIVPAIIRPIWGKRHQYWWHGTHDTKRGTHGSTRRTFTALYGWLSTYVYPIYTLDDTNTFLQSDDDDFRCVQIEQTYKSHIVQ